jgi:hypothetical protein
MGFNSAFKELMNMTAVSDKQKLLGLCSDYATGCTTEKVRIDFRQMQASVSFATANSSVVGPTGPSVHWMPGSSSPVVTRNILAIRCQSLLEDLWTI